MHIHKELAPSSLLKSMVSTHNAQCTVQRRKGRLGLHEHAQWNNGGIDTGSNENLTVTVNKEDSVQLFGITDSDGYPGYGRGVDGGARWPVRMLPSQEEWGSIELRGDVYIRREVADVD